MFMYFVTGVQESCDKINLIRQLLKVNIASRATLCPIGIAPLDLNIEEQNFTHNFIVCTKMKQH